MHRPAYDAYPLVICSALNRLLRIVRPLPPHIPGVWTGPSTYSKTRVRVDQKTGSPAQVGFDFLRKTLCDQVLDSAVEFRSYRFSVLSTSHGHQQEQKEAQDMRRVCSSFH